MKRLLLLIMILFTCGCTNNAYVYSNIDDNIFCNVKVNNSNREIINLLKQEKYFICNNLEKYLDYSILNTEDISTIVKEVNVGLYRDYYKDVALIDSVSARPGHSEHQTGLTVDINLLSKQFDKTNEYYWMINNSYKYGFILRYPMDKEKLTGYDYEPWHYRYVGRDVALAIHSEDITFDEYYAYYIDNN